MTASRFADPDPAAGAQWLTREIDGALASSCRSFAAALDMAFPKAHAVRQVRSLHDIDLSGSEDAPQLAGDIGSDTHAEVHLAPRDAKQQRTAAAPQPQPEHAGAARQADPAAQPAPAGEARKVPRAPPVTTAANLYAAAKGKRVAATAVPEPGSAPAPAADVAPAEWSEPEWTVLPATQASPAPEGRGLSSNGNGAASGGAPDSPDVVVVDVSPLPAALSSSNDTEAEGGFVDVAAPSGDVVQPQRARVGPWARPA